MSLPNTRGKGKTGRSDYLSYDGIYYTLLVD